MTRGFAAPGNGMLVVATYSVDGDGQWITNINRQITQQLIDISLERWEATGVEIIRNEGAAPTVAHASYGESSVASVSISHTRGAVGVLSSTLVGVGVDIERWDRSVDVDSLMRVARRFFSGAEFTALLRERGNGARARLFYSLWTRKEACLKAARKGIANIGEVGPLLGDEGFSGTTRWISVPGISDFACTIALSCKPSEVAHWSGCASGIWDVEVRRIRRPCRSIFGNYSSTSFGLDK